MTPTYPYPLGQKSKRSGFTLIEMMVVVAIISIAFGCFLAFMGGSSNFTSGAYNVLGVFQQAQAVAVTRSTYVWVGIFEENPANQGVAGTGQLVISTVASVDGTNLLVAEQKNGSTVLPAASLSQVLPLIKIPNMHVNATLGTGQISTLPTQTTPSQIDPTVGGNYSFIYPLSGNLRYTFTEIIQFDPQGDVSAIYNNPVQALQLGLVPAEGNIALNASKNVAAIQISGIGGKATVYRP